MVPFRPALLLAAVLAIGCGPAPPDYRAPFDQNLLAQQYEPWGYVAHAMGTIDGVPYTNSLEAFRESYAKGFRVYEVDLVILSDNTVLAAHNRQERHYGLEQGFRESLPEQLGPFKGRYTPLLDRELLQLIEDHPDIYVILDSKGPEKQQLRIARSLVATGLEHHPRAMDRLIPHVYGERHLHRLRELYEFKDYILALYRAKMEDDEVIDFLSRHGIRAVMMWWDRRYTPEIRDRVQAIGAVPFVHSLGNQRLREIRQFRANGVGVYSDGVFLDPDTLDPMPGSDRAPRAEPAAEASDSRS